jgi:hypothetical protein
MAFKGLIDNLVDSAIEHKQFWQRHFGGDATVLGKVMLLACWTWIFNSLHEEGVSTMFSSDSGGSVVEMWLR